jgi:hypothetical protein
MLPRWVDDVEREALIRPVGEQVNHLSSPQQPRHSISDHLHDSVRVPTSGRILVSDIITMHSLCPAGYDSSATMEFPVERAAALRVAIINQNMSVRHEVLRCGWMLVSFEVRGSSDGYDA